MGMLREADGFPHPAELEGLPAAREHRRDREGLDRTPPQNIELEMAVLGGIMLEPKEAFPLVSEFLSRDSFYLEGHALIFDVMADLHRQGIPPDSTALLDALRSRNLLERAGGSGVVLGMLNSVPTAANVEYHSRRVAEKANLRHLIRCSTRVIEDCYRQELPFDQVLDRAESSILALGVNSAAMGGASVGIAETLGEYMDLLVERSDEIERRKAAGEAKPRLTTGVPTGFVTLDRMTNGLAPTSLTIVGARPSMGKTALALNIAHNLAVKDQTPVLIFSLEMTELELSERLLCAGTLYTEHSTVHGIGTTRLNSPDLSADEWGVVQRSFQRLSAAPVHIIAAGTIRVSEMRREISRHISQYGIRAVIVDYLQLVTGHGGDNRTQEVSEISRGLKLTARDLRIPIVALSQLSRAAEQENRAPVLADLRESGAIEQDADVVLFIHRPKKDEIPGVLPLVQLIVAKNRNGPTGVLKLLWFQEITRFLDYKQTEGK